MPRQNRVDPFGRIVAHPARGLLMGNRGCLHDDHGRIVRASARDAWITCLPCWPGVRRQLMAPGHYTELFFLDEATAMAAGHRPCGSCRPAELLAFKQAWQRAFGLAYLPRVGEIDEALRHDVPGGDIGVDELPDGAVVTIESQAYLRWHGRRLRWMPDGYELTDQISTTRAKPLTSPAMLAVLRHGYPPVVHHTVAAALRSAAAAIFSQRAGNSLGPSAARSAATVP